MQKIPIILDGDPGHDDAIAWLLALSAPQLDVRAAVAVAGNVCADKTQYNARRILTLLGRADIPVAQGAVRPLLERPMDAPSVHGESGLDGPALPKPQQPLSELFGVELMAAVLRESAEPVTIVATGPLTDVALLYMTHPELKSRIARVSLMGGGIRSGNWTPAAEFNILVDPEAAKVVFEGGVPITMAPLDVTEKALVYEEDFARIRALGGQVAETVAEWLEFFYKFHRSIGYEGAPLHDPCAVGVLLYPQLFTAQDMYVEVETAGKYTRGETVGDYFNKKKRQPNATVLLDVERKAFVDMLVAAVAAYGAGGVR